MLNWTHVTITTNQQATDMVHTFKETVPEIGAMDTETIGLHIKCDKPFLYQFGWFNESMKQGWTYVVDLERQPVLAHQVIRRWHELAKRLKKFLGHNIKYDMHMCRNAGIEYQWDNISDTMLYIRLAHDAIPKRAAGVS